MDKAARAALLTAKGRDNHSENIADYVADLLRQGRAKEITDDLMAQADPQRLHHHYTTGNTGMDMPMDKASRMARAGGMGFDTGNKLYHGTDRNFSAFDPKRFGEKDAGWYGRGVTADTDPEVAGAYADYNEPEQGQNIIPTFSRGRHIDWPSSNLPFGNPRESAQGTKDMQALGYSGSRMTNDRDLYGNTPDLGSEQVTFDPKNVRSQFARFDPRLDHLAHLSASTGGVMDLARAVMAKQRAGGQIAPSKYLPNVPRAVHADGGRENGEVVNLGKEKLVRSITKAVSDVKSGAHQERMDQMAYKLHESGHLPLPIGTKVTPPQGWDMPSQLQVHGYWQDILNPDQHGYKLKSEDGDLYEVQHHMHSGKNPYIFGGGFKAYSGPVRNRAEYSNESMASKNIAPSTKTPEQSSQINAEYDQLFGTNPDMTKAEGGPVTDNENFQSWFGNSVTHTDGEPHVFYTGTSKDKDFTAFNVGRHGAWFTRDPEVASSYAMQNDSQGYKYDGWKAIETNTASRVIPAYIKAENPYTGEYSGAVTGNYKKDQSEWFDTLRAKGHDAWIPESSNGNLLVALREPQQIKSIYNNGKFDPNQKHMNKADGGEVDNNNQGDNQYGQTTTGNRQTGTETQGLPVAGGVRGGQGLLPAPAQASGEKDLIGLPTAVKMPKLGMTLTAGHDPRIRAVARDYAQTAGLDYNPPTVYQKVDPERAKRIAAAYEAMPHDPDHPLVKASYNALLNETLGQYQAMKRAGMKMEFYPDVNNDPYKSNPRLAVEDIRNNNHMYVYPTDAGFGSGPELSGSEKNPMLGDSGEKWNGKPVMFNDLFRAVHDYFGHAKEGVGFRADGEENAWRSHAAMYSPLARIALGTETRGQNSWLNYGPHGEKNRTATTEDTVFADQKLGILPEWAHHEGAEDFIRPHERQQMQAIYRTHRKSVGGALDLTSRFTKNGAGVMMSLKSKGK